MEKVDNKDFLWYSLYAFAGFGLEILLLMIENNFIKDQTIFTNCLHWTLTIVLWGAISLILYKKSKSKLKFDIINNNKIQSKNIAFAIVLLIAYLIIKYFVIGGMKTINEFNELGIVKFIFQYAYYFFEVVLIMLTISFGQRFFEGISKSKVVPFGGIVLACTWGLMHILTQNFATGIFAFVSAIIYGIVYLQLNKNSKYSYFIILLMFIL